jgi:hypothetical protein
MVFSPWREQTKYTSFHTSYRNEVHTSRPKLSWSSLAVEFLSVYQHHGLWMVVSCRNYEYHLVNVKVSQSELTD